MTTISVNRTKFTLAPGQVEHFPQGGAEIFCYTLSGAAEIDVALDAGEYLPFARSMGFKQPHDNFKLYNPTGTAVTGELLQANVAGVLDDRRELAAQVALNGVDVQVINSPYTDQGGVVKKIGSSLYSAYIDKRAAASEVIEIINGSLSPNGIRLTNVYFNVHTTPANQSTCALMMTPSNSVAVLGTILNTGYETGLITEKNDWFIDPWRSLQLAVGAGFELHAQLNYEVL